MSNPVQPLTSSEVQQVMKDSTRHAFLWNAIVDVDKAFNGETDGDSNMTFSARMALWATEEPEGSLKRRIGTAVSDVLNTIAPGHPAKAELADLARAEATVATLEAAPTVQQEGQ